MVLGMFSTTNADYFAKQQKSTDFYNEHAVCSLLKYKVILYKHVV